MNIIKVNCTFFIIALLSLSLITTQSCKQTNSQPLAENKVTTSEQPVQKGQQELLRSNNKYVWLNDNNFSAENSLTNRIPTPNGYSRLSSEANSFANWLQFLPLKPGQPKVKLYNGQNKYNQNAQYAVIDIDVGDKDLQQCADATMRLRAEYLYSLKKYDQITFNFTSGDACSFDNWSNGQRPVIGNKVSWRYNGSKGEDYANFKSYLQTIFTYAGTASLDKELNNVDLLDMQIGDIFIMGGFPGHAVIVIDMAENAAGEKLFMLAQSYMPAQEIHVLKNPTNKVLSPWYELKSKGEIETPEWNFTKDHLHRF